GCGYPAHIGRLRVSGLDRGSVPDEVRDNGRVAPALVILQPSGPQRHGVGLYAGLLARLTKSGCDRDLVLFTCTPGQSPGVTEMAPTCTMLQQHMSAGVDKEQSGCAVSAPVIVPCRARHPAIARPSLRPRRRHTGYPRRVTMPSRQGPGSGN